eukprot:CAMPEP_0183431584 /NCGR_PEP_ID=MMETSP0370-20130417/54918_1 /TAXON_ID=268820 /ORGANISM="Peridinium aciculiferum, Strain PAER-2" /LENGTH=137 /DNA_ID=CAMNT_0025617311 /DNA_START=74 /DNA_END=487 /DNA_ORIENTATION=+
MAHPTKTNNELPLVLVHHAHATSSTTHLYKPEMTEVHASTFLATTPGNSKSSFSSPPALYNSEGISVQAGWQSNVTGTQQPTPDNIAQKGVLIRSLLLNVVQELQGQHLQQPQDDGHTDDHCDALEIMAMLVATTLD